MRHWGRDGGRGDHERSLSPVHRRRLSRRAPRHCACPRTSWRREANRRVPSQRQPVADDLWWSGVRPHRHHVQNVAVRGPCRAPSRDVRNRLRIERSVQRLSERHVPRISRQCRPRLARHIRLADASAWIGKAKRSARAGRPERARAAERQAELGLMNWHHSQATILRVEHPARWRSGLNHDPSFDLTAFDTRVHIVDPIERVEFGRDRRQPTGFGQRQHLAQLLERPPQRRLELNLERDVFQDFQPRGAAGECRERDRGGRVPGARVDLRSGAGSDAAAPRPASRA